MKSKSPQTKKTDSSSEKQLDHKPEQKLDRKSEHQPIDRSIVPKADFRSAAGTVAGWGNKVGNGAMQAGRSVWQTAAQMGGTIGQATAQAGSAMIKLANGLGNTAFKQTHRLAERATADTGQVVTYVGDSPLIRRLTKALKLDWLLGMTDQVDVVKASAAVRRLQQEHPEDSPSQIAHRIMLEKAIYAGGVGLASSLVPGEAIALLAVDLATTTALQTEMLYQIAAAYGLDLNDPARKGEVVAIFGLALGGSRAVRAGLAFVKSVPFAGAVIGASANATILYALGYAACRFYEAKLDPEVSETSSETLEAIQQKSETYLEVAIEQQAVMDQILAQMILASYPQTAWEDILPQLQSLELLPNSLEAIAKHLQAPQPLGALLDQLNKDFAVLTLSRCSTIAHLDGEVTPPEQAVLQAIAEKFDIDLQAIQKVAARASADTAVHSTAASVK